MIHLKKLAVYLLMVLLLGAFALELAWPLVEDCLSVIRTGTGTAEYIHVSESESGQIYALRAEADGDLLVVRGNQLGQRTGRTVIPAELLPERWRLDQFYADTEDCFYITLFSMNEENAAQALRLYRLQPSAMQAELMLERKCFGKTTPDQCGGVRISGFSKVEGVVSFVLLENGTATVYRSIADGSGLTVGESVPCGQVQAAVLLSDNRLLLAQGGRLVFAGENAVYPREGQSLSYIKQAGAGVYTLDGAGLVLHYSDLTSPERFQPVISLNKPGYDLSEAVSIAVTSDGEILLLMEDGRLLRDNGSTVSDLSAMLYRTGFQSAMILVGLAAAVLAAAFALWLIVCVWKGLRITFVLRWGAVLIALALLGINAVLKYEVIPAAREEAARHIYELTGSILALDLDTIGTEGAAERIADSIAASGGRTVDTRVTVYKRGADNAWYVSDGNGSAVQGVRAELTGSFRTRFALAAREDGVFKGQISQQGQTRFCLYHCEGSYLVVVDVDAEPVLADVESAYRDITADIWSITAVLMLLTVMALISVSGRLKTVIDALERMNSGDYDVRVAIRTGDELESLGSCVNTLADTMRTLEETQDELADSYRRFLPERLLSLLEKESLADVDKQTYTSRKMATMMVWFQFPQQVYEKGGRQLFDHLNEIIERTAPIIAQNGGTVFNYTYDGYDAVFEGDLQLAISTAVAIQQEILSVNQERELDGRPRVKLRIALDVGNILMGIVGDENQMEPTAVSSSFSVAKRLIALCNELDANILCTEAVVSCAGGYNSRYMGKCVDGGSVIRTYEIYDGDAFSVRRVKEQTAQRFSEGVYLLYSRDFTGAKRIFLDLVHRNPGDGGARYYLYLAHELEKDQEQEICLDYRL